MKARRTLGLCLAGALLVSVVGLDAVAAKASPAEAPPASAAGSQEGLSTSEFPPNALNWLWQIYDCSETDSGWVARAKVRTQINDVPNSRHTYYQRVKIRIQKLGLGSQWRTIETRVYDWGLFQDADLPIYSTSGVRTPVGGLIADGGTLRALATVSLRRDRRFVDTTVYKMNVESPSFGCQVIYGG